MIPPPHLPLASTWFTARRLAARVMLLTEPHVHELLRANIWLVEGRDCDLLVDSGNGISDLGNALTPLRSQPEKPLVAVLTHAHADHQGGMWQFEQRLVHRLEAPELQHPSIANTLLRESWSSELRETMADEGLTPPPILIDALPRVGFDPVSFALVPAKATRLIDEGDLVDLGDRVFHVLHLPGHSPGGIGLLEESSGLLFSGDVAYDGTLLDGLPGASIEDYLTTMRRLRGLPLSVVHSGHDASFGRPRLIQLADEYIARRDPT